MAALCRLKSSASCLRYLKATMRPLFHPVRLALNQSFHSSTSLIPAAAAQPLMDPDYYLHDKEHNSPARLDRFNSLFAEKNTNAELDSCGPQRGAQLAFIGYKSRHHYAVGLSKLLEVPHISISSLVRQDLSPCSSLYKKIANAVNRGKHVPEDVIFGLLRKRLEDGYNRGENGFILDGIPRTHVQAENLDGLVSIDLVVNFKCTENRGVENLDLPQNKGLEDYYKKHKKLLEIRVSTVPGETWQELLAALHLQHMKAVIPELPSGL